MNLIGQQLYPYNKKIKNQNKAHQKFQYILPFTGKVKVNLSDLIIVTKVSSNWSRAIIRARAMRSKINESKKVWYLVHRSRSLYFKIMLASKWLLSTLLKKVTTASFFFYLLRSNVHLHVSNAKKRSIPFVLNAMNSTEWPRP